MSSTPSFAAATAMAMLYFRTAGSAKLLKL
jgi:hypothetical protein